MRALLAVAFLAGCHGAALEPRVVPSSPHSPSSVTRARAERWTFASIACFTAGVWDDLTKNKADSCAILAVEAIRARSDDESTLAAVRGIDRDAVASIVEAIDAAGHDRQRTALVRAVADASREAMVARRAANRIRSAGTKDAAPEADDGALSAHASLAKLASLGSPTGKVVALVLAADHLENARGLHPRAKLAAATPTFAVIFGVPRPCDSAPGAWLSYVSAASRAAGHDVPVDGSTHVREREAFAGVASGLAERFEVAVKATAGEARSAAAAYAERLRVALAEHGKTPPLVSSTKQ